MKGFFQKAFVAVGVMASAMALSSMAVFAADQSSVITSSYTTTATSKTWEFTSISTKTTLAKDDTFNDIKVDAVGSGIQLHNSGYISAKAGAIILLPVPTGSKGSVKIYNSGSDQSARYTAVEGNGTTGLLVAGSTQSFDDTASADGYVSVTYSGGEGKTKKIEVTLTSGNYSVATTYSVSGTCTGLSAGDTFTLTGETSKVVLNATVDTNGSSWSASTQSSNFSSTDTYTVDLSGYSIDPTSITLSAGASASAFNGGSISFTAIPLSELTKGKFYTSAEIAAGLPNFDVAAVNWNNKNSCKPNTGSSIKFISPVEGFMVLNGKSGSSSKAVELVIGENTVTVPAGDANNYVLPVSVGENTLNVNDGPDGSTSLYINSIVIAGGIADTLQVSPKGTDYYCVDATSTYIIHPVSDKEMKYASLAMTKDGIAVESTSTTEVYTDVVFSDKSFVTAEGIGASSLYCVEVTGTNGAAPTVKFTWIEG